MEKIYSVRFQVADQSKRYFVTNVKTRGDTMTVETLSRFGEKTGIVLVGLIADFSDWQEMELSLKYGWLLKVGETK